MYRSDVQLISKWKKDRNEERGQRVGLPLFIYDLYIIINSIFHIHHTNHVERLGLTYFSIQYSTKETWNLWCDKYIYSQYSALSTLQSPFYAMKISIGLISIRTNKKKIIKSMENLKKALSPVLSIWCLFFSIDDSHLGCIKTRYDWSADEFVFDMPTSSVTSLSFIQIF